jgi:hypothetical protein
VRRSQILFILLLGVYPVASVLETAPSKAGVASKINPKTWFKPDLRRVERQRTGIIFRVLQPRPLLKTINNPFLSNQLPSSSPFRLLRHYQVVIDEKTYASNPSGKVHLVPMHPGFQNFKILGKTWKINLFLTISHSRIKMAQVTRFHPQAGLPQSILCIGDLKRLENPEFDRLHTEALNIYTHLESFISGKFDPLKFVSPDYRDEIGKHQDFSKYLAILYRKLRRCKITSVEVLKIDNGRIVSLGGQVQWQGKNWQPFFLKLQTDPDLHILHYELDRPNPKK